MEIKYNVQAPPKKAFNGGAKSEEVKAIEDFLTSGNAKNTFRHLKIFTGKLNTLFSGILKAGISDLQPITM